MADVDIHSDPLLHLLTDALRAGPGTPAWHMALDRVGEAPPSEAAQYRKLMDARQALESGKKYRSVRAGPGFTRKVFDGLERDGPKVVVPTASVVAGICGVVAVALLAWGIWAFVSKDAPTLDGSAMLGRLYFGTPVGVADFSPKHVPDGFHVIGDLPLDFSGANLKMAKSPTTVPDKSALSGGGIVLDEPLPADEPFAIEVDLRTRGNGDDVLAQVFVSDTPEFSPDRATSPHELAWLLPGYRPTVALPGGRLERANSHLQDGRDSYLVRFVVDRDNARVETAGQLVWAGANGLSPTAPRYAGVRILRKGNGRPELAVFNAVRVLKP